MVKPVSKTRSVINVFMCEWFINSRIKKFFKYKIKKNKLKCIKFTIKCIKFTMKKT